jgi:4-amino-4-deoxy-L-arabinose transferase-like glycosyltransferase
MVAVLVIALLIRGALFLNVMNHPHVSLQPDSKMYVSLARGLQQYGEFCFAGKPGQAHVDRVPGYPLFLAGLLWFFGGSLVGVVAVQVVLDAFSCALIYSLAESLWEGIGFIAGILAAFSVGMIAYSLFILNDSLFLFLFLLVLIAMFRFLKGPQWRMGVVLGVGMGILALIRPVIIYLPFVLLPFLGTYFSFKVRLPVRQTLGSVFGLGIAFVLTISPWLTRNYMHYGRFKLTAQAGEHLLQYIVPFTWQYSRGVPFIKGMKQANEAFAERARRQGWDLGSMDQFDKSDQQVKMAIDILKREPKNAIIKAWTFGMVKNLLAPAVIDGSYVLDIKRPHFFYTPGKGLIERAWNFMRAMKGPFGWLLIGGMAGVALARAVQLWGLALVVKKDIWGGLLFVLIVGYFLVLSGPVGYAKYRLPYEPILIILLAIGIKDIYTRMVTARGRTLGPRFTVEESQRGRDE